PPQVGLDVRGFVLLRTPRRVRESAREAMRRRFLALAMVMLAAGACSGSGHHSAGPTTTGQTVAAPNPDVIPPVITPAYVNAVFVVLNHINGNAVRSLVAAGKVTDQVTDDLRAIYSPNLYPVEL